MVVKQRSAIVQILFLIVGLGILVPWWKGLDFLDAMILLAYAVVPLLLVSPPAAKAAGVPDPRQQLRRAIGVAWGLGLAITLQGLLTVHLKIGFVSLVLPATDLLFGVQLLSFSGTLFFGVLTATVARTTGNPEWTVTMVRMFYLGILLALAGWSRYASSELRDRMDAYFTEPNIVRIVLILSVILLSGGMILWRRLGPRPSATLSHGAPESPGGCGSRPLSGRRFGGEGFRAGHRP